MDLVSKYAPTSFEEIIGNSGAVEEVKRWALDWNRGKKQIPLLFIGASGVGKTGVARIAAKEMGWRVIEVTRDNYEDFNKFTSFDNDLFGRKALVLVDAVDAEFTAGQLRKLSAGIKDSKKPIIFISHKAWTRALTALTPLVKKIKFRAINWMSIRKHLRAIIEKEGISSEEEIDVIARKSGGDLRAALNDLSSGATGKRLKNNDIFSAITTLFKTESFDTAIKSADNVNENLDFFLLWVEENIAREYADVEEVAKAFDALSRADVYRGRIRKRQNWKLLKYVRSVGLGGVALAKKEKYRTMPRYAFPSVLRKLSSSKKKRGIMKSLSFKIGEKLHCSRGRAKETLWVWSGLNGAKDYFELTKDENSLLSEFN